MSSYGPFDVGAGIVQRAPHFIDLIIRNRVGTNAYRLWGAKTLNDAYGHLVNSQVGGTGTLLLATAQKDQIARTASVTKRGAGMVEESRRGQTSFQFDTDDVILGGGGGSSDDDAMFLRIQENRDAVGWLVCAGPNNVGWAIQGPILYVPPPKAFGLSLSPFSFYGVAPVGTNCTPGANPVIDETIQAPLPMHLLFPRPTQYLRIRNLDLAAPLLVSFGLGMPMMEVQANEMSTVMRGPGVKEIVLASPTLSVGAAPVSFALEGSLSFGTNI